MSIKFPKIISVLVVGWLFLNPGVPDFGDRVDQGRISFEPLKEASGLAASRKNPHVLWSHNDSGDLSRVYALDTNAKHLGTFLLKGVKARDWEDIAVGPGPVEGKHYLYVGDIGDNESKFDVKYIHRVLEPDIKMAEIGQDLALAGSETISFRYPDGRRDAETLMVDPRSRDIYIVSKWESNVRVYRAPYPQSTEQTITVEHVATLNLTNVVGGDISPSGQEIIIKTYGAIYYWRKSTNENCWRIFDKQPVSVPYIPEPQGEAVCWRADALGYYTVSEEAGGIPSHLYFYPRLNVPSVGQVTTGSPLRP